MARKLEDLQVPWLTREQLEAAIWRLTGARSRHAVEELLWAADVYAVSQGTRLARELADSKKSKDRWLSLVPGNREEPELRSQPEPELQNTQRSITVTMAPPKSVPVREASDGSGLEQLCKQCDGGRGLWKPLADFGKDVGRWNGKASACRICRNDQQKKRKRNRLLAK